MRTTFTSLVTAAILYAAGLLAAQDDADLFSKLDANKDGFVTEDEVQAPQKALFDRLMRNADKDSDKKLSKDEFQAGLKPDESPKPPLAGGQALPGRPGDGRVDPREMFNRLDANKDGQLTKDEMPARERIPENFARMDTSGDGSISPQEFAEFGRQFGPRPPAGRPNPNSAPNGPEFFAALFDRTDSNSDGKLTKDEIPEERQMMRAVLERAGGDSISKEPFVRGMMAAMQAGGQPPRPEGAPPQRPDGAPPRRPDGPPGVTPGGGLFGAIDTDRDGQLSTSEFVGAGTALLKLDRNGDGKLTPDEAFGPGGGPPPRRPDDGRPGDGRPGAPGFLETLDTDKDGKVSKVEAESSRLKDRFDQVDANGDGFIDQAEGRRMMERMQKGNKANPRRPNADNK